MIEPQANKQERLRALRNDSVSLERALLGRAESEAVRFHMDDFAPLFSDVVAFMADRQFLVYDFCHLHRRYADQAVFQMDVLFAREDSALRAENRFFDSPDRTGVFKTLVETLNRHHRCKSPAADRENDQRGQDSQKAKRC